MKLFKLSAFIITCLLFVSCSSDDNSNITGDITGVWYYKEHIVKGVTYPYEGHEACGKDFIEFYGDGGGRQVDVFNCNLEGDSFTYTIMGNTMTVSSGTNIASGGIVELTDTVFKIKNNFDYDGDGIKEAVISVYERE